MPASASLGWTLAAVEIATGGSLAALFGDAPWVRFDEVIAGDAPAADAHGATDADARTIARERPPSSQTTPGTARAWSGSPVGRGSWVGPRSGSRSGCATVTADLAVSIAISSPNGERRVTRQVFRTGTGNGAPGGASRRRQSSSNASGAGAGRLNGGRPRRSQRPEIGAASRSRYQRLASSISPARSRIDDPLALEAEQTVVGEEPQELVHGLTGAPIIAARSLWCQSGGQADRPVRRSRAQLADKRISRAASRRDVEEVELLDVGRQPAELAGERREEGVAQGRLGGDELAEAVRGSDESRVATEGRGRRAPWRAVEQRELAEESPRADSAGWPRRRSRMAARS